jgi:AcrR family transcriptional regulator
LQDSSVNKKAAKPAAPPRKPRADAARNRELILATAREAFTKLGADVTMDDVAKQAGIGPGTLYRHFPNRDALVEAVYRDEVKKLATAQRELSQSKSPVEALRAWMKMFVDYIATKQIIAPVLNNIVGGPSRIYDSTTEVLVTAITALVQRAVESKDIRSDIDPMDLIRALAGVRYIAPAPNWAESAKRMVDILILGSRPS